jgi:hypothetical protein
MNLDPYKTPYDNLNSNHYKNDILLYRGTVIYYLARKYLRKNDILIVEKTTKSERKYRATYIRNYICSILDEYEHSRDAEGSDSSRKLKPEIIKARNSLIKFQASLNDYSANLIGQIIRNKSQNERPTNILTKLDAILNELNEDLVAIGNTNDVGGAEISHTRYNLIRNVALLLFLFTNTIPKKNLKQAEHGKLPNGKPNMDFISLEINFIKTVSCFVDATITNANITSEIKKMDFSSFGSNTASEKI